jgi:hypothetical protein
MYVPMWTLRALGVDDETVKGWIPMTGNHRKKLLMEKPDFSALEPPQVLI